MKSEQEYGNPARPDPAHDIVGSVRSFGEYRPMYQVTALAPASPAGDPMVSILVIESGETLDYELQAVLDDNEAP